MISTADIHNSIALNTAVRWIQQRKQNYDRCRQSVDRSPSGGVVDGYKLLVSRMIAVFVEDVLVYLNLLKKLLQNNDVDDVNILMFASARECFYDTLKAVKDGGLDFWLQCVEDSGARDRFRAAFMECVACTEKAEKKYMETESGKKLFDRLNRLQSTVKRKKRKSSDEKERLSEGKAHTALFNPGIPRP